MAYSNYGAFLPAEALYTEPGAYSGVLRGEALKRASYLSDMDRFYEELRESSERFEKQYSLSIMQLGIAKKRSNWERRIAEEQIAAGKEQSLWERGITEEQIAAGREQSLWERGFAEEQVATGREQSLWERGFAEEKMMAGKEQSLWEREFTIEKMDFAEEQSLWERGFAEEQSLWEREFAEEQSLWEREFTEEQTKDRESLESKRFAHEAALARIGASAQKSAGKWQYELGLKELDFRKDVEKKRLSEKEEWDIASNFLSKMTSPTSTLSPRSMVSTASSSTAGRQFAPIVSDKSTTEVQVKSQPKLDKFGFRIY